MHARAAQHAAHTRARWSTPARNSASRPGRQARPRSPASKSPGTRVEEHLLQAVVVEARRQLGGRMVVGKEVLDGLEAVRRARRRSGRGTRARDTASTGWRQIGACDSLRDSQAMRSWPAGRPRCKGLGRQITGKREKPRKRTRRSRTGSPASAMLRKPRQQCGRWRCGPPCARRSCRHRRDRHGRRRGAGWACGRCRTDRDPETAPGSRLAAPTHKRDERAGAEGPLADLRRGRAGGGCSAAADSGSAASPRSPTAAAPATAPGAAAGSRWVSSACTPLPIRLVVVSWPALSRKMQLCSSCRSVSSSPSASALEQPRQHVLVRVERMRAPVAPPARADSP